MTKKAAVNLAPLWKFKLLKDLMNQSSRIISFILAADLWGFKEACAEWKVVNLWDDFRKQQLMVLPMMNIMGARVNKTAQVTV